jgi:ABC-type amino acid transport substrate-binding protein
VYISKGSDIKSILDLDGKKVAVRMADSLFQGIRDLRPRSIENADS